MANRGSAAEARRSLTCQLGTLGKDSWCGQPAVASIGAVRVCAHHLAVAEEIASDAGATVQVDVPRKRGRPRKVAA